ncbi:hypothetical protein MP228_009870 [Amoeboaphelidium protococcarum]|nr:hypothetical protein MP228_009870 [Amoeboaphelidium protococcarum]
MSVESRKEEFRKFLDKDGVIDALTNALMHLYEEQEKPENALEYIVKSLAVNTHGSAPSSPTSPSSDQVEQLKSENSQLKQKIKDLEAKLTNE